MHACMIMRIIRICKVCFRIILYLSKKDKGEEGNFTYAERLIDGSIKIEDFFETKTGKIIVSF
tara:strand:- start:54908 stop:55096 length:189 start_codon:yes stop_codon:yes gene_type:complete